MRCVYLIAWSAGTSMFVQAFRLVHGVLGFDQKGVGQLIRMAVEKGRSVRPDLKCGICGEHGGEPSSVKFCHRVGLNYVSCSPFRVPIARLAAAQAAVEG